MELSKQIRKINLRNMDKGISFCANKFSPFSTINCKM